MKKYLKRAVMAALVCTLASGCGVAWPGADVQPDALATQAPEQITEVNGDAVLTSPAAPSVVAASVTARPGEYIGDNLPVSRAMAAKMLSAAFNDLSMINTIDRVIEFTDTTSVEWYDKYINAAYVTGVMQGSGETFMPDEPVTLSQAQTLLDKIDSNNKIKLKLDDENRNKPISYALWLELYMKLLESLSGDKGMSEKFGISERTLIVLAAPGNNSRLKPWSVVTDRGPLACVGLNMDGYVDTAVRVLQKDGDIITVLSVESVTPKITNAYVVNTDTSGITVFSGGVERRYAYAAPPEGAAGKICDIVVNSGAAREIEFFSDEIRGQVLLTNAERIDFAEHGSMPIASGFKIYSTADDSVKWKALSDITVGSSIAKFIVRDGELAAAVITEEGEADTLRVAIGTSGFTGLYHSEVRLSGTKGFTVTMADGEKSYGAWEEFEVTSDMFGENKRIFIKPDNGGLLSIMSVKRNWTGGENPKYRGELEILQEKNGYVIINTVALDEYLYAVVPSEMPSGHGVDASKVQAITARSYAYNQYFSNRYHAYGANIDDSVSCQVYNNIPENETSVKAVDATRGQVLAYDGDVISANFFSTSAGYTANNGEVWAHSVTKQFPTSSSEFLSAKKQVHAEVGDLSDEEAAAAFFMDTEIEGYDSGFSWFRWNVEMTAAELAATINSGISSRYEANPPLIKTLQTDGGYRSAKVQGIGELLDLQVVKRGEGGNIIQMRLVGSDATVLLNTEYNIRVLLKPVQLLKDSEPILTRRLDGTSVSNYSIMPSAFFTFEKVLDESGKLAKVKFYGGGNGHGVGMSQNGVKGMLDKGFTVEQVLEHYYSGTEIKKIG